MRKKILISIASILLIFTLFIMLFKLNYTVVDIDSYLTNELTQAEQLRIMEECSLTSDGTILDEYSDYIDFVNYCGIDANDSYDDEYFEENSLILLGLDARPGNSPILIFDTFFDSENKDTFRVIQSKNIQPLNMGDDVIVFRLYYIEVSDDDIDSDSIEFVYGFSD